MLKIGIRQSEHFTCGEFHAQRPNHIYVGCAFIVRIRFLYTGLCARIRYNNNTHLLYTFVWHRYGVFSFKRKHLTLLSFHNNRL